MLGYKLKLNKITCVKTLHSKDLFYICRGMWKEKDKWNNNKECLLKN